MAPGSWCVQQKLNNRRARCHKKDPKGMGILAMTAIINNHLVEIIEQTESGLWLVYDTETGCFFEVETKDLLQVEY
jgi:hypothetical protein